jgi:outer membrane protein assembly factor BamD (BamD/ComL family)
MVAASLLLAASASLAPFQCASEVDPNKRREEEPGEALYALAERFKAEGNTKAQKTTLRFLIQKYPTSRFAEMARLDLGEMDQEDKPARPEGE